jgi:hypothetical protein
MAKQDAFSNQWKSSPDGTDAVFTFASNRVVCLICDLSLETPGIPSFDGPGFECA